MTNPTINKIEELDERIEDITDLAYLKKYACPKYQHKREWYLECVDCKSKNKCKAGKQAIFLINNETTPIVKDKSLTPQEVQDKKKREEIENIFRQKDPIKYLLENSTNVKPQSVYQRVNLWRKNYPDLQEKYQMIEKVRFLWTKPYDSMTVPAILQELYPEQKEEPKVSYTAIAPNSKVVTVDPVIDENSDSDSISLEDFLRETSDVNEPETADILAEKEAKEVSAPKAIQDSGTKNDISSMTQLAKKLENELQAYEEKIKEIKSQLEAIHTVQKLMAG